MKGKKFNTFQWNVASRPSSVFRIFFNQLFNSSFFSLVDEDYYLGNI